jgi:hypothetical protein
VDELDVKETVRVSRERGIEFRKPKYNVAHPDGPGGY